MSFFIKINHDPKLIITADQNEMKRENKSDDTDTDRVYCCWGVSAPLGPWGPGPSAVWPPGCVRSLGAAAVAPVQTPPAAAAADPAASGSAAAAPATDNRGHEEEKGGAEVKHTFTRPLILNQTSR